MDVTRVLLAGLSWQFHDERILLAGAETVQRFVNFFQTGKLIKPRAARANLANSLRTGQHQYAHHGEFRLVELQDFRRDVLEFRHATRAAMKDISQVLIAQAVQRLLDFRFGERHYRIAIVLLIARRCQRIQRQRIIFRRRDLLFDERTKDADFYFGK